MYQMYQMYTVSQQIKCIKSTRTSNLLPQGQHFVTDCGTGPSKDPIIRETVLPANL